MAGFERLEYLFEQNLTTDIQEYLPIRNKLKTIKIFNIEII